METEQVKSVFVTGATGLVGRHLVPELAKNKYEIRCLSRVVKSGQDAQGVYWIQGDLTERGRWMDCLHEGDAVIHLASIHEGPAKAIERVNVIGTENLLTAAAAVGINRLVYLSTVTATEQPKRSYSHASWLAENLIRRRMNRYTILRATVIVGPHDPFLGGLLYIVKHWPLVPMVGTERALFQPIWVGDVVRSLLQILDSNRYAQRTIEVGGPKALSLDAIVDQIQQSLGTSKRRVYLPRRLLRTLIKQFQRIGWKTPFTSAHLLTHGLVVSQSIETSFGFVPKQLGEILQLLRETNEET
jgi:NADH dehydrogenase